MIFTYHVLRFAPSLDMQSHQLHISEVDMNIICIVNDSLRADHCGCYDGVGGINAVQYRTTEGLKKTATPNLDRLAAEGVLFSHCYAESLPTIPTRTTWWTGRVGFPFQTLAAFSGIGIICLPKSFGVTDTPAPWSRMFTMGISQSTI